MAARTQQDLERIWTNVGAVRKISDRIVGLGPFGVGLDGLIAMLNTNPVTAPLGIAADQVYTWGAGGWLLLQGLQARASGWTLTRMAFYLVIDSAVSAVPILGSVMDLFFQGHAYAGRALQKDIETTHWVYGSSRGTDWNEHRAEARRSGKRRVVFLGD
jgi:hypothetical protein